jgi:hypothetical protein
MNNTDEYWTYLDTIVFKPDFNEPLENYYDILSQYNKIIISEISDLVIGEDYDQLKNFIRIVTNMIFDKNSDKCDYYEFNHKRVRSKFNQSITKLPNNITHLIFGFYSDYNKSIILPPNITHLILGIMYNQPIKIPEKLTHLVLDHYFDQPIELPNTLTHLILGSVPSFNKNRNKEQYNIQKLLNNLPNSLETLIFDINFQGFTINNLPNSIKNIIFKGNRTSCNLDNLPDSVECLQLTINYDYKINKIPKNLIKIKCGENYNFKQDFIDKGIKIIHHFNLDKFQEDYFKNKLGITNFEEINQDELFNNSDIFGNNDENNENFYGGLNFNKSFINGIDDFIKTKKSIYKNNETNYF